MLNGRTVPHWQNTMGQFGHSWEACLVMHDTVKLSLANSQWPRPSHADPVLEGFMKQVHLAGLSAGIENTLSDQGTLKIVRAVVIRMTLYRIETGTICNACLTMCLLQVCFLHCNHKKISWLCSNRCLCMLSDHLRWKDTDTFTDGRRQTQRAPRFSFCWLGGHKRR